MKIRNHTAFGLAAFGFATLPLAVHAQSTSADQASATIELNPMVVTAALAPRTADQSLSSVTVLDEASLRRQDPASITEVLRGQPGVDVTTQGSFGKQSSVFIRGSGSNANVLLIDGIRLRSATTGAAAWEFLDPRMFERAEIVRGPRGSLYGADAVGGVIQLFTREAEEGGPQPRISVGGGSFDTQRVSASLSGSSEGTRYSFAGSRTDTEGVPVREGGDDKGYDNTSGLVRLSHTYDSGAEVGLLALRARGNTQFDSFGSPADTDYMQQAAGVYGELAVSEDLRSRLMFSEAKDERYTSSSNEFNTETHTLRWENTLDVGTHQLVAGAEYSDDHVSGSTDFSENSRDNIAVFTQALFDFSPLSTQVSLRHDDNEAYGDELTGSLALGYELDFQHTLRASYGTAFRAPTFNDLYNPYAPNADLTAEKSDSVELGVRGQYDHVFWDLAIYQNDIDDLIQLDAADSYRAKNISSARIRGAELSYGVEWESWKIQTALTYTDHENRDTGDQLARRATQSLRLDIDRSLGDWTLGGSLVAQGSRYNDTANDERLPGFGIVNLRAGWDFAPMWSTRLTVENAFDKEYETARDYINAGRAAFVSVHFGQ